MSRKAVINRKGISLVLVALLLFALIMIAALVIDASRLYIAKQRAQNVADAAAIAGAWLLDGGPTGTGPAASQAQLIARDNNNHAPNLKVLPVDTAGEGVTVTFPTSFQCEDGTTVSVDSGEAIQVDCCVQVNYGLARVAGHTEGKPQATAVVMRKQLTQFSYPFAPWVVADTAVGNASFSELVVLKTPDAKEGFLGASNYCAIALNDTGGEEYRKHAAGMGKNGNPLPPYLVKDEVMLEPGDMSGPIDQGLNGGAGYGEDTARIARDKVFDNDATAWDEWSSQYNDQTGTYVDTPRIVIVPVVEDPNVPVHGRQDLPVVGFAAFFIETYVKKDGVLTGRFLSATTYDDIVRWRFGNPGDPITYISEIRMVK